MKPAPFDYVAPRSIEETLDALRDAGCSDMADRIKPTGEGYRLFSA